MCAAAQKDFRVVCLGGSAGGLEAYTETLLNLPADTGMAFVVAPHRKPGHTELLPLTLARATTMPVINVVNGTLLEPNRVYVMPPRTDMTVKGDQFVLRPQKKPHGWPNTISVFLFSLAEVCGRHAVAVILSGMDRDGSAALKAIKAAGGVTFAQSNPTFDSMPRHAAEIGHIDFILSPSEIAKVLLELNV